MWILFLPWLLGLLLIMAVVTAMKRWWKTAGTLLLVLVLLNVWGEDISFGLFRGSRSEQGAESKLKVLAWNIHGGDGDTLRYKTIAKRILAEDADIVYVAECFMETSIVMDELLRERYTYTSYSKDRMMIHYGHHIFSKMPITHSDVIEVEGGNERIVSCRIDVNGVELDVYGCHLTSNNYSGPKMGQQNVEKISGGRSLWNYMKGIERASAQRVLEAETIVDSIAARGLCSLIVGDMNDISASPALQIFNKAGFRDAWTEAGFGYGATFHNPLPYRIDHIFFQEELRLLEIKKISAKGLSDHDALVATWQVNGVSREKRGKTR